MGWFRGAEDARFLPAIAAAVWNETAVDVQYRRYQGVVTRKLQPLGLVLKGGVWYFVALSSGQTRTYRVSNLVEVTATDDRFERPKDFDLVRFWTMASQTFEVGLLRYKAVLRVSPRGMAMFSLFAAAVSPAAAESAGPSDTDGWITVQIPIESIDRAATDLLRLGVDAEVLEPPELRDRIASLADDISRLYRPG
jgi:predicted DNA-binding transcriptional regulator YafY